MYCNKEHNYPSIREGAIILSKNVKKELTEGVIGAIWTQIDGDTLIVEITVEGVQVFSYKLTNIYEQIVRGITAKMIATDVVRQYTKAIRKKFFL